MNGIVVVIDEGVEMDRSISAVVDGESLSVILDLIRTRRALTRPELGRVSGLGRTVVTQRVAELIRFGLVEEGRLGPSTGGRAPRQLAFRAESGSVLVAEFGATGVSAGLVDLQGTILQHREEPLDIVSGPELSLTRVEEIFDELLATTEGAGTLWGIGVGVPGPVEFATGRPIAPPIMPGWDGYPIRDRLSARHDVPVWVDNEVNLMALGELRAGLAQGGGDVLFVKVGTGIGAGLISAGRLHRGAQGCAGDIGHVAVRADQAPLCRCGNVGCLEAVAGGAAIARDATQAAREGRSGFLAELLAGRESLEARDVVLGVGHGDPVCVELLGKAGRRIGETLAGLVNFFNPSIILVGGRLAESDVLLSGIRQTIYERSLPLATRELRIMRSHTSYAAGLLGAGFMVTDELFARPKLEAWIDSGSPSGRPELAAS